MDDHITHKLSITITQARDLAEKLAQMPYQPDQLEDEDLFLE